MHKAFHKGIGWCYIIHVSKWSVCQVQYLTEEKKEQFHSLHGVQKISFHMNSPLRIIIYLKTSLEWDKILNGKWLVCTAEWFGMGHPPPFRQPTHSARSKKSASKRRSQIQILVSNRAACRGHGFCPCDVRLRRRCATCGSLLHPHLCLWAYQQQQAWKLQTHHYCSRSWTKLPVASAASNTVSTITWICLGANVFLRKSKVSLL